MAHVGPTKRAGQGMLQEFGTAHHAAQPFMRPTWDAYGAEAGVVMRDALANEIDKAAQRAAKRAAKFKS